MPLLLSHHSLEEDGQRHESANAMEIYGGEVRVSCVGGEGRGELVVWLVKFLWIKAC